MIRKPVIWLGTLLTLAASSRGAAQAPAPRDGEWWLAQPAEVQLGFVQGYIACSTYEARDGRSWPVPIDSLGAAVTREFASGGREKGTAVGVVLEALSIRDPGPPAAAGDDPYTGDFWHQLPWFPEGHLGFVEGYLSCHRAKQKQGGATYSLSATVYEHLITTWYGFDPRDGGLMAERANTPIRDVLYTYRDGAEVATVVATCPMEAFAKAERIDTSSARREVVPPPQGGDGRTRTIAYFVNDTLRVLDRFTTTGSTVVRSTFYLLTESSYTVLERRSTAGAAVDPRVRGDRATVCAGMLATVDDFPFAVRQENRWVHDVIARLGRPSHLAP